MKIRVVCKGCPKASAWQIRAALASWWLSGVVVATGAVKSVVSVAGDGEYAAYTALTEGPRQKKGGLDR